METKKTKKKNNVKNMLLAAMFMAIGLVLPFLTGQIPAIAKALSPMHLPILLCGFICGPLYGAVVGFVTPLLRSVLFGMPALCPSAVAMAFELVTYGLVTGILYARFQKRDIKAVYISLLAAMVLGRIVWGIASLFLYGVKGETFTVAAFFSGALLGVIPGIIVQLILIPAILLALTRAGLLETQA